MKTKKKVNKVDDEVTEGVFELRLKISKRAMRELRELQQLCGANSITEIFLNSIKLFKFIKEEQARGSEIIIAHRGEHDRIFVNAR